MKKTMTQENIQSIRRILPSQACRARVLWHFDRSGEYSVKSGYYLAMQIKNMSCAEASTGVSRRCIWELRVPAGVKIFLRCLWDGF